MTITHSTTEQTHRPRSAAATGVAAAVVAAALTVLGAHGWGEIAVVVAALIVVTVGVFGLVVPRALRKEIAGGTALALGLPALALTLPAFWSGLPLVLGVAAVLVGNAGRTARHGSGRSIAGLLLGAIAVLGYAVVYILDLGVNGSTGFLFD